MAEEPDRNPDIEAYMLARHLHQHSKVLATRWYFKDALKLLESIAYDDTDEFKTRHRVTKLVSRVHVSL